MEAHLDGRVHLSIGGGASRSAPPARWPACGRGSTAGPRWWSTPTRGARAPLDALVDGWDGERIRAAAWRASDQLAAAEPAWPGALLPWSDVAALEAGAVRACTRCRGGRRPRRGRARGRAPRRPVRRLRHARATTSRPTSPRQRRRERGRRRRGGRGQARALRGVARRGGARPASCWSTRSATSGLRTVLVRGR